MALGSLTVAGCGTPGSDEVTTAPAAGAGAAGKVLTTGGAGNDRAVSDAAGLGGVSAAGGGGARSVHAGGSAGTTAGQPGAGGASTLDGGITVIVEYLPDGAIGCRRDVSLAALAVEPPPPFDLIIVADHSDSLSWSRDALSAGLRNLLSNVQGRSVRVFLLTPTQYGTSSEAAQIPVSGDYVAAWKDPATGQAYTHAMTLYTQTCTDSNGQTIACPSARGTQPYRAEGTWQFDMPAPIAVITPDLTESQFAAQQEAVKTAILALSGTGSPKEQPLCTLSRYVSQPVAALPGHAVFLVISDEDDTSLPAECLATYKSELKASTSEQGATPCSANCDAYRYTMQGEYHWKRFEYHCQMVDDLGQKFPDTDVKSWLNEEKLPSCDGFSEGPCTEEESKRSAAFCPSGYSIVSCVRQCSTRADQCIVDRPDGATDLCAKPFSQDGTQYASLSDYCSKTRGGAWSDCKGGGILKQVSQYMVGTYDPAGLMTGTTTADVGRYFRSKADSAFGRNDYSVEAIVFDPSFSCQLENGQSYAKNIAAVIGDQNKLFPLCGSYAPALEHVWDFAQSLVKTDFPVPLKADEHVTSVRLVAHDGSERILDSATYAYNAAAQVLTIQREALGNAAANLRVEITSDCRPIIH